MTKQLLWVSKRFEDLSVSELYEILKLRSEIFVVEQKCIYLDPDGKDKNAVHVMGWIGDELVACSRLLKKGVSYDDYVSIGRVVVSPKYRGNGYGRSLMTQSVLDVQRFFEKSSIKIGAQSYLRKFYSDFGFVQSGDEYIEDEIPHIPMICVIK